MILQISPSDSWVVSSSIKTLNSTFSLRFPQAVTISSCLAAISSALSGYASCSCADSEPRAVT